MRSAIVHLKRADPVMGEIIRRCGPYRIRYHEPEFSTLARSIVFQQLSGKVAARIYSRLEETLRPRRVSPAGVLSVPPERLRAAGLSPQKTAYLVDLAEKTRAGQVKFGRLDRLDDAAVLEHLTQVKGVGVWTAQMFLIFALRRPDVFPTGDLGIRNAIQRAYLLEAAPTAEEMERIGKAWRPYASVASWYLWRSLDNCAAL